MFRLVNCVAVVMIDIREMVVNRDASMSYTPRSTTVAVRRNPHKAYSQGRWDLSA